MRRPGILSALAWAAAAAGLTAQHVQPAPPARPRLVVLCVVDQLAAWVYAQGAPFLAADGGFRRLERDGVVFAQCAFEHACSETGPGHATIGTGAPASRHGIARNEWWSPQRGRKVYCVADEAEALPELPEGQGRGPAALRAPTLAASLKAHHAGSRVASVAWKDRAAILMVGPTADVVAWFDKQRGNLTTNRTWVASSPDWLLQFNAARAIDQWFGRQWERSGPDAAYAGLVDDQPFERVHGNGAGSRTLPQPITGGLEAPGRAYYEQLAASPFGNTIVRLAAEAALRGLQLGADEVPDLLCIGFSATDSIGHQFGPESVEARDALLRLDQDLGVLFRALDEQVGAGQWAVFLTADHGVSPTPEAAVANGVPAGRGPIDTWVKSAAEAALRRHLQPPPDGRSFVAHVGEGSLFLDDASLQVAGQLAARADLARIAAAAAAQVRGVMIAVASADLELAAATGDPIRRALALAYVPDRAGDVQIVTQPYWLAGGLPASHGTPHSYDREVVAFAMGPRLPAGARCDVPITPGFGAVLLAHLLGIPKPSAAHEVVPPGLVR